MPPSRSSTTNENVICCNLSMSLPATSKTSLTALVAHTAGKPHSFCILRDGEALAPLCSTGGKTNHINLPVWWIWLFLRDGSHTSGSVWPQWHPPCVGGWLCLHPGTMSTPSPKADPEPQSSPQAPARHGPVTCQNTSLASLPWPGAAHPSRENDSALGVR